MAMKKTIIFIIAIMNSMQYMIAGSNYIDMLQKESPYPIDNISNEIIWDERLALDDLLKAMKDNELLPDISDNIRNLTYRYVRLGRGKNAEILRQKFWRIRKEFRSRENDIFDMSLKKCIRCDGRGWCDREVGSLKVTITMPILCRECLLGFDTNKNTTTLKKKLKKK